MSLTSTSKARSILVLLFLVLFFSAGAENAFSSSCCAGGGGQSVCVLPSEQSFQLGLANTFKTIGGHFDPYGNYSANTDGSSSTLMTSTLGGAYRLNDDWQSSVSIPFIHSEQSLSGKQSSQTSIGDPALEARYTLWEDLNFLKYRPQLSLYGGMRFPLGPSVYDSTDIDPPGDGTFTAHAGFNASKLYRPVQLTFDTSFFYPFEKNVSEMRGSAVSSPYRLKPGNRIQLVESATYLFSQRWSAAGALKQLWKFESSMNGQNLQGSAGRLFTSALSVSYFHNSSWSFSAAYETPFPFYSYAANEPYSQTVTVSALYGGF